MLAAIRSSSTLAELDGLGLEVRVLARLRVDGVDLGQGGLQGFGLAQPFAGGAAELSSSRLAGLPVRCSSW